MENFTTYTESDVGGRIAVAASAITINEMAGSTDAVVYYDFGVNYFSGDLVHEVQFTTPPLAEADISSFLYFWMMTNTTSKRPSLIESSGENYQACFFNRSAGGLPLIFLRLVEAGSVVNQDFSVTLAWSTKYYLTIIRDDDGGVNGTGRYTVYIATGNYYASGGTLIDTLTRDCGVGYQLDFRYLFATSNRGTGTATVDGLVENLNTHDRLYLRGGMPEWSELSPCPEAKNQFGFESCGGLLYAVCGLTTGSVHSKTTYAYDPDSDSWESVADAPHEVQSPVVRSVNGKLYLIGGYRSDLGLKYDNCYEYDPDTDVWAEKTPAPIAFEDAYAVVMDEKIYVFGGLTNPGHNLIPYIQVYDPSNDSWAQIDWLTPRALGDGSVTINNNGMALIISGTDDMGGYPGDIRAITSVLKYRSVDDNWSALSSVPVARTYHEAEEVDGVVYTLGGVRVDLTDFLDTELLYDVDLNKWSTSRPSFLVDAGGITGAGMAKQNSTVYFCGGYHYNGTSFEFLSGLYSYSRPGAGDGSGTLTKFVDSVSHFVTRLFNIPSDLSHEA